MGLPVSSRPISKHCFTSIAFSCQFPKFFPLPVFHLLYPTQLLFCAKLPAHSHRYPQNLPDAKCIARQSVQILDCIYRSAVSVRQKP